MQLPPRRTEPITHLADITPARATPVQPRAKGHVRLSVRRKDGRTAIGDLRQAGSLKCLFPRSGGPTLEAVLVNTAGGVTGGDDFLADIQAGEDARLSVTTQACERAYRAQPAEIGRIRNHLRIGAGGHVSWLPQETILYDRSALDRALRVEMAPDARLLLAETVLYGRTEMGEAVSAGAFRDCIDIRRDGVPLYLDAVRLEGDIAAQLARPTIAGGACAIASVVYVGPDAEAHLHPLRAMLPETAGASLIGPDLLALRLLGADGFKLRKTLLPVLTRLHGSDLPRCWTI